MALLSLYHPCVIHGHFLIFDKLRFVVCVDLYVILLFPKKKQQVTIQLENWSMKKMQAVVNIILS